MGRNKFGNITLHAGGNLRGRTDMRCLKCGVRIFYGDRCEKHKRELLKRRKRKPR
jgi:hypothetical protein